MTISPNDFGEESTVLNPYANVRDVVWFVRSIFMIAATVFIIIPPMDTVSRE